MGRTKGALNKKTVARMQAEQSAAQPILTPAPAPEPAVDEERRQSAVATTPVFALTPGPTAHVEPVSMAQASASKHEFIEYYATPEEKWRVEDGQELLRTFGLAGDDLATWHGVFEAQEYAWPLLRMRFGMAPLLAGAADREFMVPCTLEQMAEKLSLTVTQVHERIEAVRTFWLRWKKSKGADEAPAPQIDEAARTTEAEKDVLLRTHGFSDLADKDEKDFAYQRVLDLKHKLEDEEGRTIAQRAIRIELRIRRNDAITAKLERQAADKGTEADKATDLRSDIKGYHDIAGDLDKQHLALMKAMNATQEQNPSVQRKVAFRDCIGQLIRGIQEYESNGDNTIIDGVFTAAEVKLLTTPMSLRPPQYRLDIVMITREAMRHENLWNPEYEPPAIERGMYRRLRKALRDSLMAMENEDGGVLEMEDDEVGGGGSAVELTETPATSDVSAPAPNGATTAPPLGGFPRSLNSGSRVRPGDEISVG